MKKVNLLSRAEMKNVMGGIISIEVFLEMCYQGKFGGGAVIGDGSVQDEIRIAICKARVEEEY